MKRILELVTEIENWNDGDKETFNRHGEVPFDGVFVFSARQVRLTELRKELKRLLKQAEKHESVTKALIFADENCHYEAPPEFQDVVKFARKKV